MNNVTIFIKTLIVQLLNLINQNSKIFINMD